MASWAVELGIVQLFARMMHEWKDDATIAQEVAVVDAIILQHSSMMM